MSKITFRTKMLDYEVNAVIQKAYSDMYRRRPVRRVNEDIDWKDATKEGFRGLGRTLSDAGGTMAKMATGGMRLVGADKMADKIDRKVDDYVRTAKDFYASDYGRDAEKASDVAGKVAGNALGYAIPVGALGKLSGAAKGMNTMQSAAKGLNAYGWKAFGDGVGDTMDAFGVDKKYSKAARLAGDVAAMGTLASPAALTKSTPFWKKVLWGGPAGFGIAALTTDSAKGLKDAGIISGKAAEKASEYGDYAGFGLVGKPIWDRVGSKVVPWVLDKTGLLKRGDGGAAEYETQETEDDGDDGDFMQPQGSDDEEGDAEMDEKIKMLFGESGD